MRGSRAPVCCGSSGKGAGLRASHDIRGRSAGSQASSRCSRVVPVRCSPAMKTGAETAHSAISGWRSNARSMRSRFTRARTRLWRMMRRPSGWSLASRSRESSSTRSGSRKLSSAKPCRPLWRRAARTSDASSNGMRAPNRSQPRPRALRPATIDGRFAGWNTPRAPRALRRGSAAADVRGLGSSGSTWCPGNVPRSRSSCRCQDLRGPPPGAPSHRRGRWPCAC